MTMDKEEEVFVDGEHIGVIHPPVKKNLVDAWFAEGPSGGCHWASYGEALKYLKKMHRENNK